MTKVTRLPKDPGPAGWAALLPEPPGPRLLEEERTADWLVIGAGFAGLAAARRLTQLRASDRVVVLEATRVGWGVALLVANLTHTSSLQMGTVHLATTILAFSMALILMLVIKRKDP